MCFLLRNYRLHQFPVKRMAMSTPYLSFRPSLCPCLALLEWTWWVKSAKTCHMAHFTTSPPGVNTCFLYGASRFCQHRKQGSYLGYFKVGLGEYFLKRSWLQGEKLPPALSRLNLLVIILELPLSQMYPSSLLAHPQLQPAAGKGGGHQK